MIVTVALVQLNTGDDTVAATDILEGYIREAAGRGAQLISTPETSHLMEMNRKAVLQKASSEADDVGLKRLQALAAELKIWLHIGSLIIKIADDRLANRGFLIADDGSIKARYDKLHLFDIDLPNGESYRESRLYEAGENAVLAETPFGTIALTICYDLRFPHLYRRLAEAGADIIMVPAAFTVKTGEAHWHTLLKARAIETGCYVLAAAQTGKHATGRSTYGHSLAVDPWGTVIADAKGSMGVTLVELDLAKVAETRLTMPSLGHKRAFGVKRTP
ncbi:MAG: amidohydrolase [Kordiimonadales bacterium]|nr:MAG: amidohydrolase [Kordiimonadales bacterium]